MNKTIVQLVIDGNKNSREIPEGYEQVTEGRLGTIHLYFSINPMSFAPIEGHAIGSPVDEYICIIKSTSEAEEQAKDIVMQGVTKDMTKGKYQLGSKNIPLGWHIVECGHLKRRDMLWSILQQDFVEINIEEKDKHSIGNFVQVIRKIRKVNNNPLSRVIKAGIVQK